MKMPSVISKLAMPMKEFDIPYFELNFGNSKLVRYTRSGRVSDKRVCSLLTKEPGTIHWLEHFTKDDVFVDIGANVGMYSVYASVMTGCQVHAFEPESLNYAELNKNIHINKLDGRVRAYCAAMSNQAHLSTLYLSRFSPAYSHHDFHENRWDGPVKGLVATKEDRPRQGCVSVVLDAVVCDEWIPPPTHIKIDVDGFEWKVIKGATYVLQNPHLKTILVETDFSIPESVEIMDVMQGFGWDYSFAQIGTNRYGYDTPDVVRARIKHGKGGNNIIYFRDPKYHGFFETFAEWWTKALQDNSIHDLWR